MGLSILLAPASLRKLLDSWSRYWCPISFELTGWAVNGVQITNLRTCALFVLATSPTTDNTKLSVKGSEGTFEGSNDNYHSQKYKAQETSSLREGERDSAQRYHQQKSTTKRERDGVEEERLCEEEEIEKKEKVMHFVKFC